MDPKSIPDGGPAFPHTHASGMTPRDYFAAKAIAEVDWANNSVQNGTKWAYELADAMLAQGPGVPGVISGPSHQGSKVSLV